MDKTLLMNAASTAWQRLLLLWMTCKEVTLDTGDGPGLEELRAWLRTETPHSRPAPETALRVRRKRPSFLVPSQTDTHRHTAAHGSCVSG